MNSPFTAQCSILLSGLELEAFVGWGPEERARPQTLRLDITVLLREPPAACQTDDLADTVCYDSLAKIVKSTCDAKPHKLLEHLGFEIYRNIREKMEIPGTLSVKVTKLHPPIPSLREGASFTYSDANP